MLMHLKYILIDYILLKVVNKYSTFGFYFSNFGSNSVNVGFGFREKGDSTKVKFGFGIRVSRM